MIDLKYSARVSKGSARVSKGSKLHRKSLLPSSVDPKVLTQPHPNDTTVTPLSMTEQLQRKWGSTKNIMRNAKTAAMFRDAAKAHFCEELYKVLRHTCVRRLCETLICIC